MPDRSLRLALLLAVLTAPRLAAAQPPPDLDPPAFAQMLDGLAARIETATPVDAATIRRELPGAWRVRAGGETFIISSRPLSAALVMPSDLGTWPAARRRLAATVRAMRAEADALIDAPAARDPRERAVLDRVLSAREFQRSAAAVWLGRLQDRLTGWLADLLQRFGRRGPSPRAMAIGLAWLAGLLALAALAWWLVRSIVGAAGAHRLGLSEMRRRKRSSGAWARLALAAHEAGDAREATRCGYHAAVTRIEEEGAWKVDEALTPREYLRLLPAAHRRRPIFTDVLHRFERVWYGAIPATADDSRVVLSSLKDLGCLASDQAI